MHILKTIRSLSICATMATVGLQAQPDLQAEYFFDQDPGPGQGTPITLPAGPDPIADATISITGLGTGLHDWYVRTKQNGAWGFYGQRRIFYIWDPATTPPPTPTDIEAAEYFFDQDPGVGNGTAIPITPGPSPMEALLIDVTGLPLGTHTWNVRTKQNGTWGFYGEQRTFTICNEGPGPAITYTPSGSCTNGTFTMDVTMPADWAGDPYRAFNNVNTQTDTIGAGETATIGPFSTGTELLITAGSALDSTGCTDQYHEELSCWYQDADGDGYGDPDSSVVADAPPMGYVGNDSDSCPLLVGIVGDTCDDGDSTTVNDVITADCICVGVTGIGSIGALNDNVMELIPNPARDGQVTLRIKGLPQGEMHAVVLVLDAAGHRVRSEAAVARRGALSHPMDLSLELSPGLYIVEAIVGGHRYLQRLVIR